MRSCSVAKIDYYLETALKQGASDLHFVSGDPVRARIHGTLQLLLEEAVTTEVVQEALFEIMISEDGSDITIGGGLVFPRSRPSGRIRPRPLDVGLH